MHMYMCFGSITHKFSYPHDGSSVSLLVFMGILTTGCTLPYSGYIRWTHSLGANSQTTYTGKYVGFVCMWTLICTFSCKLRQFFKHAVQVLENIPCTDYETCMALCFCSLQYDADLPRIQWGAQEPARSVCVCIMCRQNDIYIHVYMQYINI